MAKSLSENLLCFESGVPPSASVLGAARPRHPFLGHPRRRGPRRDRMGPVLAGGSRRWSAEGTGGGFRIGSKAQKTLSIRVNAQDYSFLNGLAEAEKENISEAVRTLVEKGRVMLAVEHYRAGKASLGKAAEIAGLSVSELMDKLAQFGVPANLEFDDYLRSLSHLKKAR